ncbi:MAG: hypothetical protein ACXWXQ_00630 [Actinomycetota bacterium]
MSGRLVRMTVCLLVPAALTLPACGGDDEGGESAVAVTLQEFAVVPDTASVDAGSVTFEATNDGPDDPHELVVVATELDPQSLPTDENGAVDEAGDGIEVIGEIEEFAVGETESATFELEAGSYVLICNIWDEDEQESHYQEGMRTAFTVA